MTSPAVPNQAGASINVPNDTIQIQVPAGGMSILNTGSVGISLAPTDPVQGNAITLNPGAAIPWSYTGTLYASLVNPSGPTGSLYTIPGVEAYAGNLGHTDVNTGNVVDLIAGGATAISLQVNSGAFNVLPAPPAGMGYVLKRAVMYITDVTWIMYGGVNEDIISILTPTDPIDNLDGLVVTEAISLAAQAAPGTQPTLSLWYDEISLNQL